MLKKYYSYTPNSNKLNLFSNKDFDKIPDLTLELKLSFATLLGTFIEVNNIKFFIYRIYF